MTDQELQALAYARKTERDVTEIENIRDVLKATIENDKEKDTENLKNKIETEEIKNTFKKIAENTSKETNTNV